MTAFYIGQHEIEDEAAFADYLKETMPFIESHGGRYLTKAAFRLTNVRHYVSHAAKRRPAK